MGEAVIQRPVDMLIEVDLRMALHDFVGMAAGTLINSGEEQAEFVFDCRDSRGAFKLVFKARIERGPDERH